MYQYAYLLVYVSCEGHISLLQERALESNELENYFLARPYTYGNSNTVCWLCALSQIIMCNLSICLHTPKLSMAVDECSYTEECAYYRINSNYVTLSCRYAYSAVSCWLTSPQLQQWSTSQAHTKHMIRHRSLGVHSLKGDKSATVSKAGIGTTLEAR